MDDIHNTITGQGWLLARLVLFHTNAPVVGVYVCLSLYAVFKKADPMHYLYKEHEVSLCYIKKVQ